MKEDEIRLIKEAHRLIDVKSDDIAKVRFLEASDVNPQSVRADFYMGLLNSLVIPYPPAAEKHFRECVQRLAKDDDLLTGTRKANYVAALNNLAVTQVRLRKYAEATASWRRAIEIAPFMPELVQNLGLMTKLSQTARFVRIPRGQRTAAADLYAKVTVQNSLAKFDDNVGWLIVPYVDTLDGSMDESGDEELVTVAWCTGFCVAPNYVLTSRYPLREADRIVVNDGGNVFEIPSGKFVAISDRSNLALVRIDGLSGSPFSLTPLSTKPSQTVTITGYREPGFTNDTIQTRTATILDLPNILRHVDTSTFRTLDSGSIFRVAWFDYRDMVMHDAITSAGMEGAPVLNQRGRVVAVHIGNRPELGAFGSKFSFAEPSIYAISFLEQSLPDIAIDESESEAVELDSQRMREQVQTSIYQLAIQRRAPRLTWSHRIEELHRLQRQGDWTSYEDKTCMACNGRLQLNCPHRGCTRGVIRSRERELKYTDPNTGNQVWGSKIVVNQCPTCSGNGFVRCPNCGGDGTDIMLR